MAAKPKNDRMAWFKFDAGTFIADTTALSHVHVSIYIKLQALYWIYGTELTMSVERLKRTLGITGTEEERILSEVIKEFFSKDPDEKLCHVALDRQLRDIKEHSAVQAERGRLRHAKPASPKPEVKEVMDAEDYDQF